MIVHVSTNWCLFNSDTFLSIFHCLLCFVFHARVFQIIFNPYTLNCNTKTTYNVQPLLILRSFKSCLDIIFSFKLSSLDGVVCRTFAPNVEGWCFSPQLGQIKDGKIETCSFPVGIHHLKQDQCQYKVTGWGTMFIYSMVFQCAGNQA